MSYETDETDNNDTSRQITKQERKLLKQQALIQKMTEQQQQKQFLLTQNKLENNKMTVQKHNVDKMESSAYDDTSLSNQTQLSSDIRDTIEKEIVKAVQRKELLLEQSANASKKHKNDEISLIIKQTKKESEAQIYHYDRVLDNMNVKLKELQKTIRKLGGCVNQMSRSSNRVNVRNSMSNASVLYKQCECMIGTMIEDEQKRVRFTIE